MTGKELQDLCREWQGIMRLQDWNVAARFAMAREFPPGKKGACHYTQSIKQATILILEPVDYPPNDPYPQDIERDLVHELEHLHFAPFMSDKGENHPIHIAQEQAIECNACALVALKRGARA